MHGTSRNVGYDIGILGDHIITPRRRNMRPDRARTEFARLGNPVEAYPTLYRRIDIGTESFDWRLPHTNRASYSFAPRRYRPRWTWKQNRDNTDAE